MLESKNTEKGKDERFLSEGVERIKTITSWLKRIGESNLSLRDFFKKYDVPFGIAQYFTYQKKLKEYGKEGLLDKRLQGSRKKLNSEGENFIKGCIAINPATSPKWLREQLEERYGLKMSASGITRILQRLTPEAKKRTRGRPQIHKENEYNTCGGLEIIVTLGIHLGWTKMVGETIEEKVKAFKRTKAFRLSGVYVDKEGRDEKGRFTKAYTERRDVNEKRFKSIEEKRVEKNWTSMNIMHNDQKSFERKSLAVLVLPVLTSNGNIRTVNTALGQQLKHCCVIDYKQNTLAKYLSQLKYLGMSDRLLKNTMAFWAKCWESEKEGSNPQRCLCYYIDGNTKAVWSSNRIKQNKVSMLGRVMGCLEQVFIHDGFGRPIYFETYSGNGPCGKYVLKMMEKVEEAIEEVPGSRTSVSRVLIMDASSNSVNALRSFATQKKYHYITPLDDNQWNERKINRRGRPKRYQYGEATLREIVLELEDSQEKGYLIRSRAIKINWDHGKETVLMTSLPLDTIDASEVVRSYFNRWPAQELQFKEMKSSLAFHRIAGYGKQKMEDKNVVAKQKDLSKRLKELRKILEEPFKEISKHEQSIAKLIPKERRLKNQSTLKDGKGELPKKLMEELASYGKEINRHNREIKKIENAHQRNFKLSKKHSRQWLHLQGKETVYKMDVELDQIMTFYRISLANLYAYFIKHFLGGDPVSMSNLLHQIIYLPATIKQNSKMRKVIFHYNKKNEAMMKKLSRAIEKLNALNVVGPQGKKMQFYLKKTCDI